MGDRDDLLRDAECLLVLRSLFIISSFLFEDEFVSLLLLLYWKALDDL